jgi:hypothetical protein
MMRSCTSARVDIFLRCDMRKFLVVALMVLPLLAAGCSKGPAEAALKAADEAIAKVAPRSSCPISTNR